jgi:hypothetical protein
MVICCGMVVQMVTVTLSGKGRDNLTCFVYQVHEINIKMFP